MTIPASNPRRWQGSGDRIPGVFGKEAAQPAASWAVVLLLLAVCTPLYFGGIGSAPLLDPDEPYYAIPAAEMLHAGDWRFPLFHGEPWLDKPILFYWLVAASFKVLGISEMAARVPSALAALATVLGVFELAHEQRLSTRDALVAALVLGTSLEFLGVARIAITDMTLTLTLTLAMLLTARYLATGALVWAGLAGAGCGLAILTKGPVGAIVPVVALAAYAFLARRGDLLRPAAIGAASAGALVVAGPWFAYAATAHADLLLDGFLVGGNLGRFTAPEHASFPLFYVAVLMLGLAPWSGGLPAAVLRATRPRGFRVEKGAGRRTGPLYALCWFGAVVGVFSLSASKLATYVLPAFPPLALLIGGYWSDVFANPEPARPLPGVRASAWLGLTTPVAAAAAVAFRVSSGVERGAIAALGILSLGGLVAFLSVRRRSLGAFVATNVVASVAVALLVFGVVAPTLQDNYSHRDLVARLRGAGLSDRVIGTFGIREEFSLDFYLGRAVPRTDSGATLREIAAANPDALWVVQPHRLEPVAEAQHLVVERVAGDDHHAAVRIFPAPQGEGDAR